MVRLAATALAVLMVLSSPVFAQTAPAPAAPAVDAVKNAVAGAVEANTAPDDKRMGQMRERWRKMTPEQRDDMRKKSERRLQERYDRLKPEQQNKINGIIGDLDKLTKEEKSILMAKVRQKSYKERQQRKLLKELDNQGKSGADAKPADTKPVEAKPAEAAPAATH